MFDPWCPGATSCLFPAVHNVAENRNDFKRFIWLRINRARVGALQVVAVSSHQKTAAGHVVGVPRFLLVLAIFNDAAGNGESRRPWCCHLNMTGAKRCVHRRRMRLVVADGQTGGPRPHPGDERLCCDRKLDFVPMTKSEVIMGVEKVPCGWRTQSLP